MGNGLCPEEWLPGSKVLLYSSSNTSLSLRDAKMDRLQQASEGGLSLSLYVDGRYGSISTNRLNRKELETFIKKRNRLYTLSG